MNCKLCQSSNVRQKYTLDRLDVGQCRDCRFTFITSNVADAELMEMYTSEGAVDFLVSREARNVAKFEERLVEIKELHNGQIEGLRLLDVGCGAGDFCYLAAQNGIKAVGIDISGSVIEVAQQRYGEHAEYQSIDVEEMVRSGGELFDVVTLWDVIEHCTDPCKVISCCRSLVKKGGFICINTPNCNSLYDKLAAVAYRMNLRIGKKMLKQRYSTAHLQLWSKPTLKKLFGNYGMEVVMSRYIRELTMLPSDYIKAMGAGDSVVRAVGCVDGIGEKLWPIRNKVLAYAQVK